MANWREIIRENVEMKNLNTFRIQSKVKYYAKPENLDQLLECLKFANEKKFKIFVLGNGSNIIFSKEFYPEMLVIDMKNFSKIELRNNYLIVDAGVKSNKLLNFCIKKEISSFEFIAGIPGTIGGMIMMNAGAFGNTISENLVELKVLDIRSSKIYKISRDKLKFQYRNVEGLSNKILIQAKFKYLKDKKENIKDRIKKILKERKEKQPSGYSAGSIFKNLENNYAGKLIELCGLKGFKINDAYISEKHANFIINKGNAKGSEIIKLIELVKQKVLKKTGKHLKEEVIIV